jgi:hypothetical protein
MAKKLGYTWYPKDWGNSESVFELSLSERGLYRELIDLAMFNDNKTEVKLDVWIRKFGCSLDELNKILEHLLKLELINIKSNMLFIPSCESRLVFVRTGSTGGKSKGKVKGIVKGVDEGNSKGMVNQRERERERENKNTEFLNENLYSESWLEVQAMQNRISVEQIKDKLKEYNNYLFSCSDTKINKMEYNRHFTNWLKNNPVKSINTKKQTLQI